MVTLCTLCVKLLDTDEISGLSVWCTWLLQHCHPCIYSLLLYYSQGLLLDAEVERELIKMNKQLLQSIPVLKDFFFVDKHQQPGMYIDIKVCLWNYSSQNIQESSPFIIIMYSMCNITFLPSSSLEHTPVAKETDKYYSGYDCNTLTLCLNYVYS